ncbi:MAG: hypothetical protein JW821_02090 [Deltaproteobacteria bacterium]|nr:hypothetical protein [Deltaproteobacteria bacterium]
MRRLTRRDFIGEYGAVVVGSAVRNDKWLPEAIAFVVGHRNALKGMPAAYFLSCLTLSRSDEKTRQKAMTFLNPVREAIPEVEPVDVGLFAGVLDYSRTSFPMRVIMRAKMKQKGVEEGDYRNWDTIRTWSSGLQPKLNTG